MNSCLVDDFVDDYEDNEIVESEIGVFINELKPVIIKCVKNYFSNKIASDGSFVDESLIEMPYYLDLLFRTTLSDGVIKAYKIMEDNGFSACDDDSDNIIADDIKYMINLISGIQKFVPQEFVGGVILMHLELIEGFEVW